MVGWPRIVLAGAAVGLVGGLIGLGGAEFRLPLLIGLFGFAALEAVILNKATSLIVVATALPFRAGTVPLDQVLADSGRLDALVNAAGVWREGPVESFSEADFDLLMNVNVKAAFFTCAAAIPHLRKSRGTIINIASDAGHQGNRNAAAYCASKAGVIAYLQSLRAEQRTSPVTVHTVCPGYLRTALTAHNNFAMPGLMEPADAARSLLQGVARGREFMVLPRRLGWLARLLNLLPTRLHDRLLLSQPRKARVGEAGATAIPGLTPTQTD